MSKKHIQALSIPPKFPTLYQVWTREDGQQFTYSEKGWWLKVKNV